MPADAPRSPVRAPPYIYSRDELARLFDPATVEASRRGAVQLDAVTFRTLLLLLYGAGLRFGEATRLILTDRPTPSRYVRWGSHGPLAHGRRTRTSWPS